MILLVLLGALVGAVLGLTGAGGSILAVPLLMFGLGWSVPEAAPVALLAVCAATTFGTVVAWDVAFVRYRAAMLMALAAVVTAPLGVRVAQTWPVDLLTLLFAGLLVLVAVRLILLTRRAPDEARVVRASVAGDALPARGTLLRLDARGRIRWSAAAAAAVAAIGGATGFVAGLLGVGGGFVIVPGLRAVSPLSMHSVVATSLLAVALISGIAALGATLQGVDMHWRQAVPFVAGSLAGMLAGRRLAPRLAGPRLQQALGALMMIVAAGLVVQALGLFQET